METQGWPLWAVSQSTGQVWAVVAWDGVPAQPLGIEIGVELDLPQVVPLHGLVRFCTDAETVRRLTR